MLKQNEAASAALYLLSAAFGRLRVETDYLGYDYFCRLSAAFGRLRVETLLSQPVTTRAQSAAFGRLRVETRLSAPSQGEALFSRLRAAAC